MKSRTGINRSGRLVVVVTTVGSEVDAKRISKAAVEAGLAACVQSLPIRSVYRWNGRVEDSAEIQLLIKTPVKRKTDLMKWLADTHPYETPEIIALPVLDVSSAYLSWAEATTQGDEAS